MSSEREPRLTKRKPPITHAKNPLGEFTLCWLPSINPVFAGEGDNITCARCCKVIDYCCDIERMNHRRIARENRRSR